MTPPTYHTATLVGLGGIGSWLVRPVAARLRPLGLREMHLWDGDTGERRNLTRQLVVEGQAKAHTACAQLTGFITAIPHTTMLTLATLVDLAWPLIIASPDNHACRRLLLDAASTRPNVALILAGNETDDGNVLTYARTRGREHRATPHPFTYHPDLLVDPPPDGLSCAERLALGDTQALATNYLVGAAVMVALDALLRGEPIAELFVDARQGAMRAAPRGR